MNLPAPPTATLMDGMTDKGADALEGVGADPEERLAAFVAASLRPPVVDARAVGLWAGYLHNVQCDAALLALHEKGYLRYRDTPAGPDRGTASAPDVPSARLRREAIACNAVIDGLWLEGGVLPQGFGPGELVRIGLMLGRRPAGGRSDGAWHVHSRNRHGPARRRMLRRRQDMRYADVTEPSGRAGLGQMGGSQPRPRDEGRRRAR